MWPETQTIKGQLELNSVFVAPASIITLFDPIVEEVPGPELAHQTDLNGVPIFGVACDAGMTRSTRSITARLR